MVRGGPAVQLSMASYRSPSGPCFAGHCLVMTVDGVQTRVEQLQRGMEVITLKGPRKVAAIVRTALSSGQVLLCRVGDELDITPWHPIRSQGLGHGKWIFPAEISIPQVRPCNAVYSVLLVPDGAKDADAHCVCIGGTWCVTLGHGLTTLGNGDIRAHTFLGDYAKVLGEISRMYGFYDPYGIVKSAGTKRSRLDGTICGFVDENEAMESRGIAYELKKNCIRVGPGTTSSIHS